MASITGQNGFVTRQVSGVDTYVSSIREWSIDYTAEIFDVTSFAETAPTHKEKMAALQSATGTFMGNHTDGDTGFTNGSTYNIMLGTDSNHAYYGAAIINQLSPSVAVAGEALMTYSFEFTGKTYILGADVVVDGDFSAASSAAWDVSDANISYDTSNDQIDWDGDGDLVPASNDVITNGTEYWTQMLLENEDGTTACVLKLGTEEGTSRTADGTYTEFITADDTTFTVSVTTTSALSLSEIQIRPVLN